MSSGERLLRLALVALLALQEPALCLAQPTQAPGASGVPAGPRLTDEERRALEAPRRPARETPDERARREAVERWHREARELEERQPIRERNLREAALGLKPVLQERADGSTSAVTGDLWNVLERATLERALARQGLALAAQARLREQLRRAVARRDAGAARPDLERALGGPRAKRRGCRLHQSPARAWTFPWTISPKLLDTPGAGGATLQPSPTRTGSWAGSLASPPVSAPSRPSPGPS